MAVFEVNQATGDNANSGVEGSPVKSLAWAIAEASAGDVIKVSGTSKTAPLLHTINCDLDKSLTVKGVGKQYISGSLNLSQGQSRGNLLEVAGYDPVSNVNIDGGCDLFVTGENRPLGWLLINANPVVKEETIAVTGNSAKMAGAFTGLEARLTLPPACEFQVDFECYNASSGNAANTLQLNIRDSTSGDWWRFGDATPAWGAAGSPLLSGTADDEWLAIADSPGGVNRFTTLSVNRYQIRINNSSGAGTNVSYLDNVELTNTSYPTYAWTAEGDGVYSLPCLHFVPRRVFVTTADDWESSGIMGFEGDDKSFKYYTSLADCEANEYSFYFNSTTATLYANFGALNPADLHIEASPLTSFSDVTAASVIADLNIALYGGLILNTAADVLMQNIRVRNARGGVNHGTGALTWRLGECAYIRNEPSSTSCTGVDIVQGGTGNITGVVAHHNDDDGFQADGISGTDIATLNLEACVAHHNHSHGITYKCLTNGTWNAKGSLKGVTSYANDANGLDDSAELTFTGHANNAISIDGFAAYDNGNTDMAITRTNDTGWSVANTFVANATTSGADVATGVTTLTEAPFNTDTLRPEAGSPLIGEGHTIAAGVPPVDMYGEPLPVANNDAGGVVSKLSPWHPRNL